MSHKSFGPVPPDKFKEAVDAPAGKAATILREYAPSLGLGSADAQSKKYAVVFTRETTSTEKAKTMVEATSEEQARGIAEEMNAGDLEWHDNGWYEPDEPIIDSVELLK
jgi:hypothetical protein